MDKDIFMKRFRRNFLHFMYYEGLTQKELSEITDISEVMLSKYINGKAVPNLYNTYKIAIALNCTINDLIE